MITKATFKRKALIEQHAPNAEFVVEGVVTLSEQDFDRFKNNLLDDANFIKENKEMMYVDNEGVWHVIMVTSDYADHAILVNSEGYDYARYSAYVLKEAVLPSNPYKIVSAAVEYANYTVKKDYEVSYEERKTIARAILILEGILEFH